VLRALRDCAEVVLSASELQVEPTSVVAVSSSLSSSCTCFLKAFFGNAGKVEETPLRVMSRSNFAFPGIVGYALR